VRRLVAFCTSGMTAAPVPLATPTVEVTNARGSKKRKKRLNAVAGVG